MLACDKCTPCLKIWTSPLTAFLTPGWKTLEIWGNSASLAALHHPETLDRGHFLSREIQIIEIVEILQKLLPRCNWQCRNANFWQFSQSCYVIRGMGGSFAKCGKNLKVDQATVGKNAHHIHISFLNQKFRRTAILTQVVCMPFYIVILLCQKALQCTVERKQMFSSIVIWYYVFQVDLLCHYLSDKFVCFTFNFEQEINDKVLNVKYQSRY